MDKNDRKQNSLVRRRRHMLAAVCILAVAGVTAAPYDVGSGTFIPNAAFANPGGGNGHGRDSAPGQQKQTVDNGDPGSTGEDAAVVSREAEDDGDGYVAPEYPAIAEDNAPGNIQVIKEIMGLPENSALSEEEELEAIRSGWGTWRTADGPDTVLSQ